MTGRTHDSTPSNTTYLVTLVRSLQYIREPTGTHHAFPITSVTLQCRVSWFDTINGIYKNSVIFAQYFYQVRMHSPQVP